MTTLNFIFTLAIFFAVHPLFSQDTIPNQDFEDWNTNYSPEHWETTTDLLPPGYITCHVTSLSYSGNHALQLKSVDMNGYIVPGVVTLGTLGIGYTEGGVPFTARPQALKGFFQHPSSGDLIQVFVQFFKSGNPIGGGSWSTADSIPDYMEFTVPISFLTAEDPDTMNITILTDQETAGSSILLDALHFEYPTTSILQESGMKPLQIYPNPCSTQLIMDLPPNESFDVSIYNMSGQVMLQGPGRGDQTVDTSALPPGAYTLEVKSSQGVHLEKFIKQ